MSRRTLPLILLFITLGALSGTLGGSKGPSDARSPRFKEYVKVLGRAYYRVGLTVTVTDRSGLPVRGLTRHDFRIFEDGTEVTMQDFGVEGDNAERPLSVAVLL